MIRPSGDEHDGHKCQRNIRVRFIGLQNGKTKRILNPIVRNYLWTGAGAGAGAAGAAGASRSRSRRSRRKEKKKKKSQK